MLGTTAFNFGLTKYNLIFKSQICPLSLKTVCAVQVLK